MIHDIEALQTEWSNDKVNTTMDKEYKKIIDGVCHCPEPEPMVIITVNSIGLPIVDKSNIQTCKLCGGLIPSHKLLANDKKMKGGKKKRNGKKTKV